MKLNQNGTRWFFTIAGCLLFASQASRIEAQTFITDSYTNTFDVGANTEPFAGSGSVASWLYWYNTPGGNIAITNDVTMDAATNAASGSLKIWSPFGTSGTQNVLFGTFGNGWGYDFGTRADLSKYTNITFDIRVDTNLALNGSGNYGNLGVGIINKSYQYKQFGTVTIPADATNRWIRMSVNINQTEASITDAPGIAFAYNNYGGYPQFPMTFWLDNVAVHLRPGPPPPPPTTSLSKATPGLNLINSTSAGANGRQNIHPLNPSYSWIGVANPVSFKITVKDYPVLPTGYQTHLFLAPQTSLPYGAGDTSVDWNSTNLVFVQIQNITNGGQITFMYKTNFGSGWGGQVFGSNNLGGVQSAVMNGTWTVTFENDTNVSLTAPDNTTTNIIMPPDSAAMFAGSVYAWIGSQANGADKVGLSDIIERIEITGFPSDNVNDNFPGPGLNTNFWAVSAADPAAVQVVSPTTAYWLNWTVPDIGFSPQSSPLVGPGAVWTAVSSTPVLFNGLRHVQVTAPSSSSGYFRLLKREFSQLLVLMPGETNAPGTATGKIGTPDTQPAGNVFKVTVMAVSSDWYPITGVSHSVHFTSTDGSAFMTDGALTDGVGSFDMFFQNSGSWTVTAEDVTDPTKLSNTGSAVTVTAP